MVAVNCILDEFDESKLPGAQLAELNGTPTGFIIDALVIRGTSG